MLHKISGVFNSPPVETGLRPGSYACYRILDVQGNSLGTALVTGGVWKLLTSKDEVDVTIGEFIEEVAGEGTFYTKYHAAGMYLTKVNVGATEPT